MNVLVFFQPYLTAEKASLPTHKINKQIRPIEE